MKTLAIFAAAAALMTSPALAQNANAPGQERDCLITWSTAADATAGADAKAISGKYLPRNAADAQAAQSGGTSRVFDYSNSTQKGDTGSVTITNNDEERSFCEGAEFNHATDNNAPGAGDHNGNGKATGNPGVGNPGNDKPVGNAGENPSEKSNAGGNGNGQGNGKNK